MRIYGGKSGLWGRGLSMGRRRRGIAVGPMITAPGSIDVSTFKIGTTQTITAGTATATGGGTVTYEFRHLANGAAVSSLAAYAHVGANDGQGGAAQWRAVETGGTNDGATAWQTVASGTITYPAPVAAGGLVNQSFTDDTGVQTYDASGDFTGSALVFSLVSPPSGVTINSGSGVVSFDTDALALQTGTSITVRATNSGGFDDSTFLLDIVAGNSAPVISGVPTISGSPIEAQTLTATAASVTGTPSPTRTWQWKRGGVDISGATSSTYTLQAADVGSTITVTQTETNVAGSDSATSAATATVTGQQITLSGVSFNGTDTISMTVNRAGTIYWMITDNATETAAAVIAGTGAIDSGNFAVVSGSNNATISYPNTPAGNHYLHIVADAATSPAPSAVDSTQYTFPSGDTTAPILTSPTDAANGQTASTGSVTTDEGNGTLYWVVTTSSTAPSAAQVKNGLDATGSPADGDANSQAVTVVGVQNITPSGLTASTSYTTHFMHEDAAGNQSAVVSASGFTTAGAGGGITFVNAQTTTHPYNVSTPLTVSYTPAAAGNILVFLVSFESGGTSWDSSIYTGGANIPTWNSTTVSVGDVQNNSRRHCASYVLQASTTSAADFVINPANGIRGAVVHILEYSGVDTASPIAAAGGTTSGGGDITPTVTTVAADGLLVGAATFGDETVASTASTGTQRGTEAASGGAGQDIRSIAAEIAVASAGASEGITFNQVGNTSASSTIVELKAA